MRRGETKKTEQQVTPFPWVCYRVVLIDRQLYCMSIKGGQVWACVLTASMLRVVPQFIPQFLWSMWYREAPDSKIANYWLNLGFIASSWLQFFSICIFFLPLPYCDPVGLILPLPFWNVLYHTAGKKSYKCEFLSSKHHLSSPENCKRDLISFDSSPSFEGHSFISQFFHIFAL